MKLTLAITVYNRYEMLLESFANVIDDDRIDEILIMDDCSDEEYWKKIKELPAFNPKIKVVRQLANRGMSQNKHDAIFNSKNEWVIIFDSDNKLERSYIDSYDYVRQHEQLSEDIDDTVIICPSYAKPNFDYTGLLGPKFGAKATARMLSVKNNQAVSLMLNTCNYIVNRDRYLQVWEENKEMKGSDTIWFNYLWLKSGGSFLVAPNMHYFHRLHDGSGFMQDVDYNMKKAEEIKKLIMAL